MPSLLSGRWADAIPEKNIEKKREEPVRIRKKKTKTKWKYLFFFISILFVNAMEKFMSYMDGKKEI